MIGKLVKIVFSLFVVTFLVEAHASLGIEQTRVVFPADEKIATFGLNSKDTAYTIRSWITDSQGQKVVKNFLVSPPLLKTIQDGSVVLKIVQSPHLNSQLPTDRESLFYLNIKAVALDKQAAKQNELSLDFQLQFKLFYRPQALVTQQANPWKNVTLTYQNEVWSINNDSPFYLTLGKRRDNDQPATAKEQSAEIDLTGTMIAPFSHQDLSHVTIDSQRVVLAYIDDSGLTENLAFTCVKHKTCHVVSS